ncbi:MAG TPA: hypothetical protein VGJ91_18080, partial [Polyangiaceae bacterium]
DAAASSQTGVGARTGCTLVWFPSAAAWQAELSVIRRAGHGHGNGGKTRGDDAKRSKKATGKLHVGGTEYGDSALVTSGTLLC